MPTLSWIGKEAVVNHHREVPFHLLKDVPELSSGAPGSGNLIVQGDNLVALKALLPYYAGQVKCIYIDPPYNTGNEGWVYNDNVSSPVIREWLGKVVGHEGETLDRHDRWLCMMYPRLALLKRFLRPDGSIWISMDDSEIALLRVLMDEIFGHERFVACNVWQKRYSRENREAIGDVHEYLLLYALDPELFKATRNRVGLEPKQLINYKNPNNDPGGPWQSISMTAQGWRPNQMYEIVAPNGNRHSPPEGRCWSMIEVEYNKLRDSGRLWWGKDGNGVPREIRYLSDVSGLVPWTWWPHEEVGHTDESRKEIQSILGTQTAFDTPKPTRLLERVLQIATSPGDLVLDSFAGSGTTGHAVLKLNVQGRDRQSDEACPGRLEAGDRTASCKSLVHGSTVRQAHGSPRTEKSLNNQSTTVRPELVEGLETDICRRLRSPANPPCSDALDSGVRRNDGESLVPATLADANADAPDKEPRRFILIEMEPKIAREVTAERVRRVAEGYTNAKGQPVALVVDPSQSVDFRAMTYEPSWLYEGGFQFRKHYFGPKPGELRERAPQSGAAAEEFLCAQHIDGLPEVRFWVRNLSRKESSFRLQTSTDWFYPDFVCKLVDDRILAVEYKGSNLYDTTDAEEKRAVGAVWAARSGNRCLFVMPTGRDFSAIDVAVESTNFDERSSDKSLVHGSTARHAHGSPRTDNHE